MSTTTPPTRTRSSRVLVVLAIPLMLGACSGTSDAPTATSDPAEQVSATATETQSSTAPPSTPADKETAINPAPRNGQITSAERYLAGKGHGYDWRDFDPLSETGLLFVPPGEGHGPKGGLAVVGRAGPVATLKCDRDLPCGPRGFSVATLGPGADEVTVAPGDRTAKVIGHDGTLRRRMDLTPTISAGGHVAGLRWSPNGSRLAILTTQNAPRDSEVGWVATRVWLLDREGDDAQLAYTFLARGHETGTIDAPAFQGKGIIWFPGGGWSWSPDGQSLLLDVLTGSPEYTADNPAAVVLHLPYDGAADPAEAQTLYRSDRIFDWWGNVAWSPDGTRIAVRSKQHITEISAEDGSVIAQHPHDNGWVIWPAR